jgi:hypothetical protein
MNEYSTMAPRPSGSTQAVPCRFELSRRFHLSAFPGTAKGLPVPVDEDIRTRDQANAATVIDAQYFAEEIVLMT